jgi:hypothetical protein
MPTTVLKDKKITNGIKKKRDFIIPIGLHLWL